MPWLLSPTQHLSRSSSNSLSHSTIVITDTQREPCSGRMLGWVIRVTRGILRVSNCAVQPRLWTNGAAHLRAEAFSDSDNYQNDSRIRGCGWLFCSTQSQIRGFVHQPNTMANVSAYKSTEKRWKRASEADADVDESLLDPQRLSTAHRARVRSVGSWTSGSGRETPILALDGFGEQHAGFFVIPGALDAKEQLQLAHACLSVRCGRVGVSSVVGSVLTNGMDAGPSTLRSRT